MKRWLKRIISALSTKTNELRIRIMIFLLLHKHTSPSLSHKLHVLLAPHHPKKNDDLPDHLRHDDVATGTHLLTSYNVSQGPTAADVSFIGDMKQVDDDDDMYVYPDLTHDLFRESEAAMEAEESAEFTVAGGGGAAAEGEVEVAVAVGEDVDRAAELFIKRIRQQIQRSPEVRLLQSN